MKFIVMLLLVVAIVFVGYHAYQFYVTKGEAEKKFTELQTKLDGLETENKKVQNDIQYYSNTANLLKELRSQLNYHWPDEKTIIVVPKKP
ncbi:MAG: septum formation initiator family protein [bacterium]|nr:septum formation initiator family protein [bacterium]